MRRQEAPALQHRMATRSARVGSRVDTEHPFAYLGWHQGKPDKPGNGQATGAPTITGQTAGESEPTAMGLLTVADVAKLLGLSEPTIHRLKASGKLRAVRFGRSVRFRPADVEALISASVADPDASGPRAGLGWAA